MIFIIGVVCLFIAVGIFFFFKSEKLQEELRVNRKEHSLSQKNGKALADTLALITSKQEEFLKARLEQLTLKNEKQHLPLADEIRFLTPLIHNYGIIFREGLRAKALIKPIVQKCVESQYPGTYKEFTLFMDQQDRGIRKLWAQNNVNGFVSLVEALLLSLADKADKSEQNTKKKVSSVR